MICLMYIFAIRLPPAGQSSGTFESCSECVDGVALLDHAVGKNLNTSWVARRNIVNSYAVVESLRCITRRKKLTRPKSRSPNKALARNLLSPPTKKEKEGLAK
jgi:hypothetical protein